jgi:phenylalanyl-tRNA synthetase beta chain
MEQWNNFFVVKGILEGLWRELGIANWDFQPLKSPNHPTAAIIRVNSTPVGLIGLIRPISPIVYFDLDFDTIAKLASDQKTYEPIPKYPPVIEDLSMILPPKTLIADVISLIKKQSKLIREVEVTDIYPEKGSVTLHLTYQHTKKTLTDKEVSKIRQKIISTLEKNLKAEIRQKA